jgi:ATP/maltotriose-dependent transcriptional regulator MalT
MTLPLAKTSVPSVRHALARERLFRRLDAPSDQPIVWVSGSPGAGKTTLVATYVGARKLRCIWYHVDAGDADLASFFFYLAEAATRGRRGRRVRLPLLTPEHRGSEAAFARRFFRELVSLSGPDLLLVFDDVTEVGPDSALYVALREGLEELAGGARAVLISRVDPPAAFARLLANGSMARLSGDDLRLDPAEALAIARSHAPRGASAAELTRACDRADGWAAGVVLLASGAGPRIQIEPSRPVFDYLASEVFNRASPVVRNVLLDAAVVTPIPARLADRLCGSGTAGAILTDLASKAYFTSRRDGADSAFELHPLFRDFLLARGRAERPEHELRRHRSRAGALLAEEGYVEHAMALLIEAQAWSDAARIGLAQAPSLMAAGRGATLARWLGSIPGDERERRPWIAYWLGMCRLAFDTTEARGLLEHAYAGFDAAGDVGGLFASCAAALEAIVPEWRDFGEMDPWIARLEALGARGLAVPSRELELRLTVAMFAAMTFHRNDRPELLDWEDRALRIIRDGTAPLALRLTLAGFFVVECTFRGEIGRSRGVVDMLAPLARAPRVDPAPAIAWFAGEAVHHWHSGAAAAAARAVETGLALARESGVHIWDYLLQLQGVNAALADDDLTAARSWLAAATRSVDDTRPLNVAVLEHEKGLVALRAGDLDAAVQNARVTAELGERGAMPFTGWIGRVMLALAATQRGDAAGARADLEAARRIGARIRSSLSELVCELCEADLARRAGDIVAAREHLARAFRIVREKGVAPDVWFSRDQLAEMCAVALEGGVEQECARALVRRLELAAPGRGAALDAWPWPVRVRLLGAFEVTVEDRALPFRGRLQRRPLDLLAAIAAFDSRGVPEHVLEDALWPESDGAHHALETSLYRLRRLLGDDVVQHRDRILSIEPRRCWVDAVAFEAELAHSSASVERADLADALHAVEIAVHLYRGPFLAHHEEPWVLSARTRIRRRFQLTLGDLARHGAARSRLRDLSERAAAVDPALDAAESGPSVGV